MSDSDDFSQSRNFYVVHRRLGTSRVATVVTIAYLSCWAILLALVTIQDGELGLRSSTRCPPARSPLLLYKLNIGGIVVLGLVAFVLATKMRGFSVDAYRIQLELLGHSGTSIACMVLYQLARLTPPSYGAREFTLLLMILSFGLFCLAWPIYLSLRHAGAVVRQQRALEASTQTIRDIPTDFEEFLQAEDARESWLVFLRAEFSTENMCFLQDAANFRTELLSLRDAALARFASFPGSASAWVEDKCITPALLRSFVRIVSLYCDDHSQAEINISSESRRALLAALARVNNLSLMELHTAFDPACNEVYRLLQTDTWPRFRRSDIFLQLMLDRAAKTRDFISLKTLTVIAKTSTAVHDPSLRKIASSVVRSQMERRKSRVSRSTKFSRSPRRQPTPVHHIAPVSMHDHEAEGDEWESDEDEDVEMPGHERGSEDPSSTDRVSYCTASPYSAGHRLDSSPGPTRASALSSASSSSLFLSTLSNSSALALLEAGPYVRRSGSLQVFASVSSAVPFDADKKRASQRATAGIPPAGKESPVLKASPVLDHIEAELLPLTKSIPETCLEEQGAECRESTSRIIASRDESKHSRDARALTPGARPKSPYSRRSRRYTKPPMLELPDRHSRTHSRERSPSPQGRRPQSLSNHSHNTSPRKHMSFSRNKQSPRKQSFSRNQARTPRAFQGSSPSHLRARSLSPPRSGRAFRHHSTGLSQLDLDELRDTARENMSSPSAHAIKLAARRRGRQGRRLRGSSPIKFDFAPPVADFLTAPRRLSAFTQGSKSKGSPRDKGGASLSSMSYGTSCQPADVASNPILEVLSQTPAPS